MSPEVIVAWGAKNLKYKMAGNTKIKKKFRNMDGIRPAAWRSSL
jgi:hypothetical protein